MDIQTESKKTDELTQYPFNPSCKTLVFLAGHASDKTHYKGPFDCLKSIYRQQGIRGWYKGLVPMAWRYVLGENWYKIEISIQIHAGIR